MEAQGQRGSPLSRSDTNIPFCLASGDRIRLHNAPGRVHIFEQDGNAGLDVAAAHLIQRLLLVGGRELPCEHRVLLLVLPQLVAQPERRGEASDGRQAGGVGLLGISQSKSRQAASAARAAAVKA